MQTTIDGRQLLIGDGGKQPTVVVPFSHWAVFGLVLLSAISLWTAHLSPAAEEFAGWWIFPAMLAFIGLFSLLLNGVGCLVRYLVGAGGVILVIVDKDRQVIEAYEPQVVGNHVQRWAFEDVISVGRVRGSVDDDGTAVAVALRFRSGVSLVLPQPLSKTEVALLKMVVSTAGKRLSLQSRSFVGLA